MAGSVALLGFGIDSAIEGVASVIVIWRFTGTRRRSEEAERRAQMAVAISFFLLAPYIAQDAIRTLINGEHPTVSWVGIGLSISSMIVMPVLGRAKQRIGDTLGSGATAGDGNQNMLCAYISPRGPGRPVLECRVRAVVGGSGDCDRDRGAGGARGT